MQIDSKNHETPTDANNVLGEVTYRGDERRQHTGIYGLVSLGRGRKLGKVDCPFCNTVVDCYLWSISGSGKKCKCGAVIYRTAALRNLA
jgi:hypothetical protein